MELTGNSSVSVHDLAAARSGVALGVVGLATAGDYVAGRANPHARLLLVVGAGLTYAWVDFADKLLATACQAPLGVCGSVAGPRAGVTSLITSPL